MEPAIYRQKDVLSLLGVSKASLWRWRRAGEFPHPIKLGPNTVGWRREIVHQWILSRPPATGEAA